MCAKTAVVDINPAFCCIVVIFGIEGDVVILLAVETYNRDGTRYCEGVQFLVTDFSCCFYVGSNRPDPAVFQKVFDVYSVGFYYAAE